MASAQHGSQAGPSKAVLVLIGTGILAILLGIVYVVVQPFQSAAAAAKANSGGATQTVDGGQVTIKVTWQGREAGAAFKVVMDTHSVDLDGIDLRQVARLRVDGSREVMPLAWDAPKGGHHREGKLVFPDTAADGRLLLGSETRTLELVIRDVAGVQERAFKWQV